MSAPLPSPEPCTPTREQVDHALAQVIDPELGLSITDLGLVRHVSLAPGHCEVTLTLTSAACPMGNLIVEDALQALRDALGPQVACAVGLETDPPWTPEALSERARALLGA